MVLPENYGDSVSVNTVDTLEAAGSFTIGAREFDDRDESI